MLVIIVVDWCCMYNKCKESIDHLLFHCEVAKRFMEFAFPVVWCCMAYASKGEGVLGELEGNNWGTVRFWKCGGWVLHVLCGVFG